MKSHASEQAARAAAPYWTDATVVSIQNGINERLLARHANLRQLVMGMTATNIAIVEPGRVSLQLGGATILGPPLGPRGVGARRRCHECAASHPLRRAAFRFEPQHLRHAL